VQEVTISETGGPHHVTATRQGQTLSLEADWVIDASGRAAILKQKLGLKEECSHHINAVWFRIGSKISIDTWCKEPSWTEHNHGRTSRWFSTNHLMGEGYWVWIIPLASGSTSLGIVSDPRIHPLENQNSFEKALGWLSQFEPVCAAAVEQEKHKLQDFLALKNFSRRSSQLFSTNRWALTGDCGIFIDPLYSPGSDYIAFSNTLICDLIARERAGKKVSELTKIYNELLISFADNTFLVYQDLYQVFGNPRVMPVKVIWDFAVYWSFFAFLFAQNKLTDLTLFMRVSNDLKWLSTMNREMQSLFI
jgi:flavin-dependent dehydrogenase